MLTVKEVAKILKVHPMTVYRLIKRDELKAVRIGNTKAIRIGKSDPKNFILSVH